MQTALAFIFVFGLMVFFHEFGHYIMARINGITVHEFALGMGPVIYSHTSKKTDIKYSIRALPIGGYVKMEGEDEDSSEEGSFNEKKPWQRFSVIIGGPFMNFILSIILLTIVGIMVGTASTTLLQITPDSPAQAAGLLAGDRIVAINQTAIKDWNQVISEISGADQLDIIVERDGMEKSFHITPKIDEESGRKVIGIITKPEKNVIKSISNAGKMTYEFSTSLLNFLREKLSGKAVEGEVLGPVGIVQLVGSEAKNGFTNLLFLAAYLSVNLGIINLLPFPALDGGRLIFIFIEMIRGKAVPPEKEGMVHLIGFIILMSLMALVVINDITRIMK